MSTRFVEWHTHKELESIAKGILDKYKCVPPIDIDYIIEIMGLEIIDINRLKEDFGLFGFLAKVKNNFTIFIQRSDFKLTNYHANFTLAEELAHYILHKDYFENVTNFKKAFDFYSNIKEKSEMIMEFNAKYLAGAILVPYNDILKQAKQIYIKNKKTLRDILDGDIDRIIDYVSMSLTDIYRVSDSVIARRLKSERINFRRFLIEEKNNS